MPRNIDMLIVHCAATQPTQDIGVAEIRQWHTEKGWSDVGYHYVIRRNGTIEDGRAEDSIGAHTVGYNARSIGICMVGGINKKGAAESNFTPPQWLALERLLRVLRAKYPAATIHGHREFAKKDCPSFDVQAWIKTVGLI